MGVMNATSRSLGYREALAASMLLSPEEQKGYVRGLARALGSVEDVSRTELEAAVDLTRSTWQSSPVGDPRDVALSRAASDARSLQAVPGRTLAEVAQGLVQATEARQARLTNVARLGIGGALAGFMGAMALPHPVFQGVALAVGLGAAATAGWAGIQKHRTPEMQTLLRLGGYGAVAVETRRVAARRVEAEGEVRALVDSLGRTAGPEVTVGQGGVQVGGVWLPRREG